MTKKRNDITALTKTYDLLLWIIPQLEKLPRGQKFLLGDRIEAMILDIMGMLVQAVYTRDKTSILTQKMQLKSIPTPNKLPPSALLHML